jgi:hypothetical protein
MAMTIALSRRTALTLGLAAVATPSFVEAAASPVLVELFTSQGCSSCPPADRLLGRLKKQQGVYAVSLNVDYWDYLGWRDTLAKAEYSQRQFDYGKSRGDMKVYTPQIVVNGRYHAVGSDSAAVETMIAKAHSATRLVPMQLEAHRSEFSVSIAETPFEGTATLWLMAIAPEKQQVIERGENAGETVTYHNVVRNMVPAAMWDGKAFSQKWTRDAVLTGDCRACLAVLQQDKTGPVIGLAQWGPTFS